MKYLVVLIVVFAVLWLMSSRRREVTTARRSAEAAAPQAMVSCVQCGVHLPRADATQARDGRWFCSAAHLKAGGAEAGR